jgi:nucleotide-binding universal stress UspA family protein
MKILIGYDGSLYSIAAIDDLQRAALPPNIEVLVVSVGDTPIVPPFASHEVIEKALVGERVLSIVEHANKHVSGFLKHASVLAQVATHRLRSLFPSWQVEKEVLTGIPAVELVRRAEEWQADLIVVGSQGRSAIGRLILGSVSLEVATKAECSVRIGRRSKETPDLKKLRILVGLDGSLGAEQALRKVLRRPWPKGTELRIIAVDDGTSSITRDMASAGADEIQDTAFAEKLIELAAAPEGVSVSAGIRVGNAQDVLLTEANHWGADCIVVGSRGAGDAQEFFARSVSTGLAANAACSVEIIR